MNRQVPNQPPLYCDYTKPRIALIGEAPGADEEMQGKPFVGYSGQLLNQSLAKVGILRTGCFVGNCYQYRPPGNKIEAINKNSIEWHQSIISLGNELRAFDPHITVALGKTPLKVLTGETKISNWRGSIMQNQLLGRGVVIPTFHPAYVLRQYKWLPIMEFDLRKALKEAEKPQPLPSRTYETNPSFTRVIEYLHHLHTVDKFSFDFETLRGRKGETCKGLPLCLGFAERPDHSLCIPFGSWTLAEEFEIWKQIQFLMQDPAPRKIVHNFMFDCSVFARWAKIWCAPIWMDTMIAMHACYPELPKKLAFACSIFTREPYYKHEHKESEKEDGDDEDESTAEKEWSADTPKDKLYRYNCKDCCVTYEIAERLEKELDFTGSRAGYETDMKCLPLALSMTMSGIKFDYDTASLRYAELQADVEALGEILNKMFEIEVNTKSPKQICEIIYRKLGLPVQRKRNNKGMMVETSDADALLKLAQMFPENSGLMLILRNRQLRTKQSFFNLDVWRDGRVHASYNVAGTETGRWSSSSSILGGRNLMNIPEDCRDCYIPG